MRPHSPNYYLQPGPGVRLPSASATPQPLDGYVPGTAVYEAGDASGSGDPTAPYRWTGTGPVPFEVYQLAAGMAHILGEQVPGQMDAPGVAFFLANLYNIMTQGTPEHPGEGCGIRPAEIEQTLQDYAYASPVAVVYGLQELIRRGPCASLVVNPIPMQAPPRSATTSPPASSPTTPEATPVSVPEVPRVPEEPSSIPWGWVLGGVGLLGVVGVAIYFATRRPKRRNPSCGPCGNPRRNPPRYRTTETIDTEGYEVLEFPESSRRRNPRRRRRARRTRRAPKQRARARKTRARRKRRTVPPAAPARHVGKSAYAIPERRLFPIKSKKQARRALTFSEWPNNRKWRGRVHKAVFRRYPELRTEWYHRGERRRRNSSVEPGLLERDAPFASPVMRRNPKRKTKRARKRAKR